MEGAVSDTLKRLRIVPGLNGNVASDTLDACAEFEEFRGRFNELKSDGPMLDGKWILTLFKALGSIDGLCQRIVVRRDVERTSDSQAVLERGLQALRLPLQHNPYWRRDSLHTAPF
jgi:hypothetical protein